jgi:hypothetical protein
MHRTLEIDFRWSLQRGPFGESHARLQARRAVREHRCFPSACGRDGQAGVGGSRSMDVPGVSAWMSLLVILFLLSVMLVVLGFVSLGRPKLIGVTESILALAAGRVLVAIVFSLGNPMRGRRHYRKG